MSSLQSTEQSKCPFARMARFFIKPDSNALNAQQERIHENRDGVYGGLTLPQRSEKSPEVAHKSFDHWCFYDLPELNTRIDGGEYRLIMRLRDEGISAISAIESEQHALNESEAQQVISNIGMFLASMLAHGEDESNNMFTAAKELCIFLSKKYGILPRDTFSSYINESEPVAGRYRAFTTLPDEQAFIHQTKLATSKVRAALAAVKAVKLEDYTEALCLLDQAIESIQSYQETLQSFMKKRENGNAAVRPEIFYEVFRQYFPNLEIARSTLGPPSAAYSAEIMEFDLLIGTTNERYIENVMKRMAHFTKPERENINKALESTSLLDRVVAALEGVVSSEINSQSIEPINVTAIGQKLLRLCEVWGKSASTHWGLVSNYLVKPYEREQTQAKCSKAASVCPVTGMRAGSGDYVVDPTKGASGMLFEEVREFRDLRRGHSSLAKLQMLCAN